MTEETYLTPPEAVDMGRAERSIRLAGVASMALTAIAVAVGYFVMPLFLTFPTDLIDRLAFAAQAGVFVLIWVLIAVGMVSTSRRFSPQDIGGSAAGPPSKQVAIYRAFLQNTLEQAVLTVGLYLALASLLTGPWLSVIPVSIVLFAIGRILFLRGYARGVTGRAFGMTLTMVPTLIGYIAAIILTASAII